MIVDGALDVRCKDNIKSPLLYTSLSSFFLAGTGYNFTLLFDVEALWDTIDSRFVLWTIDRDIVDGYLQDCFVVAVSKTADPTDGWNFMVVNASAPYTTCVNFGCTITEYNLYSSVDSPFLGFSGSQLYVISTVFASNTTTPAYSPEATGTVTHALWAFPKALAGGVTVYQGNVLPAQEGVHYTV